MTTRSDQIDARQTARGSQGSGRGEMRMENWTSGLGGAKLA